MTPRLVFDSNALLKFFQGEPGAPDDLIFQAAEYKAEYSIAYGDCFVLACAVNHAAAIVTGDPEFKKVSHLAKIHWV